MMLFESLFILRFHGVPGVPGLSLIVLLILILNIVATFSVAKGRLVFIAKLLWLLAIWLFFPPIGALLYFLFGRTRQEPTLSR